MMSPLSQSATPEYRQFCAELHQMQYQHWYRVSTLIQKMKASGMSQSDFQSVLSPTGDGVSSEGKGS